MEYADIRTIVNDVAQRFGCELSVDEVFDPSNFDPEVIELLAESVAAGKTGQELEGEEVDLSQFSAEQNLRRGIEELREKRSTPQGRAEPRIARGRPPIQEV